MKSSSPRVLVYGAYGYTGVLIVNEALKHQLKPLLAGRNKEKLASMATMLDLEFTAFDLADSEKLKEVLSTVDLVIHCAGPFIYTAQIMALACIETKTHYIDITGEYNVFEQLRKLNERAKQAGVMLLPGAGFDVVPSDCLANQLKDKLPNAENLTLAFTTKGAGLSRGTAKTMVENVDKGHMIREDGKLVRLPLGEKTIEVNYGPFEQVSVGISWGDISTAHYSTGVPNITVYTGTEKKQLRHLRIAHALRTLLGLKSVKRFIQRQIDKKTPGPSEKRRKNSETYLWGKATVGSESIELRLKVPNGYDLTASAVIWITKKVLDGDLQTGYQTPAMVYGKDLIFELEGCYLI